LHLKEKQAKKRSEGRRKKHDAACKNTSSSLDSGGSVARASEKDGLEEMEAGDDEAEEVEVEEEQQHGDSDLGGGDSEMGGGDSEMGGGDDFRAQLMAMMMSSEGGAEELGAADSTAEAALASDASSAKQEWLGRATAATAASTAVTAAAVAKAEAEARAAVQAHAQKEWEEAQELLEYANDLEYTAAGLPQLKPSARKLANQRIAGVRDLLPRHL
jgi:hypothetical protein